MRSDTRPAAEPPLPASHLPSTDAEGGLSPELRSAMAGARRRAARDADRQVDTAHVLHSLLEADPAVRGLFEGTQIARLLGYLVQRSIGFGLQWQESVEDSGTPPGTCDEERPASGRTLAPASGASPGSGTAGCSPAAAGALLRAAARAAARGRPRAEGVDLLAALVADRESRAVEVLRSAGIDIDGLSVP